jgi:hypothetical protein
LVGSGWRRVASGWGWLSYACFSYAIMPYIHAGSPAWLGNLMNLKCESNPQQNAIVVQNLKCRIRSYTSSPSKMRTARHSAVRSCRSACGLGYVLVRHGEPERGSGRETTCAI